MSIRSRLLLLVLALALPALIALLGVLMLTAHGERAAKERALRDVARAMSMVVERELDRRDLVARMLARSRSLKRLPQLGEAESAEFLRHARDALVGFEGWLEVRTERGVLLDTRGAAAAEDESEPGNAAVAAAPVEPLRASVSPLLQGRDGARILLSRPVLRGDTVIGQVGVAMLPSELQRLVDAQELPDGWVSTVMDRQQTVVARRPGGAGMVGHPATDDLRRRVTVAFEGAFESRSPDGSEFTGFYSNSPSGWTYITEMPSALLDSHVRSATLEIVLGATVLLLLAVTAALWVSGGVSGAVLKLKEMAADVSAGRVVEPRDTGIDECDDVAAVLVHASGQTRMARAELESQVEQAVERTRAAEQQASRAQRVAALGRLTGGVAHDFNNLLGVVSNSAHLVERHVEGLPQLRTPVAAILRAVDLGSRLTQQLMRFAGRRTLRPQSLDLRSWRSDFELVVRQVVGKRISLTIAVEEDTLPVLVDAGELELALLNLTLNARDSMPEGGALNVLARNAQAEECGDLQDRPFVVIDVSDTGQGMDSATAGRVFEPFFTTKPVGEGTGLGLAQVHGFCTQAGGAARLTTSPGQGTTVRLMLPAAAAAAAADDAAAAPMREKPGPDSLRGVRVLVVEDNDALGDATAVLLRSFGAEVARVRDAGGAVDALERGDAVDLVLSDVLMPGPMDGVGLAQQLRTRSPPLPVVLTSGYAPHADELRDFVFLQKPVSDETLVAALRAAAGRSP